MGEILNFVPPESTDAEHAYACIQFAINGRRDAFIAEYQAGKHGSTFQTYEDELDRAVYRELGKFRGGNQEAFDKAKKQLDANTTFELQTFIGERLNVGLSTYRFNIEDGALVNERTGEPIIAMIDRGRKTRNAQVDKQVLERKIVLQTGEEIKQRHDAEVEQFIRVQELMGNPQTVPGTTMISISPPGPGYVHNFYDVFVLKEENGKRFIEARRYASALKAEDSLKRIQAIKPDYGKNWGDTSLIPNLLREPIVLDDPLDMLFNNPDGIHAFIQMDPKAMNEADFALVKEVIAGIISVYLKEVFEHSDDADRHAEILDALKNKADEAAGNIKKLRDQAALRTVRRDNSVILGEQDNDLTQAYAAALADIGRLGSQPVRTVTTGCGESGSSRKNRGLGGSLAVATIQDMLPGNMSPFSLLDEILDGESSEGFECPNCHVGRVKGNQCPHCKITAQEWVDKNPELACA